MYGRPISAAELELERIPVENLRVPARQPGRLEILMQIDLELRHRNASA
jgi:hypothetical protein